MFMTEPESIIKLQYPFIYLLVSINFDKKVVTPGFATTTVASGIKFET